VHGEALASVLNNPNQLRELWGRLLEILKDKNEIDNHGAFKV